MDVEGIQRALRQFDGERNWQPLLAPEDRTMVLTVMITVGAIPVEAQSSSDFLLLPRERSTGYFCSFTVSFASAAATGSMPSAVESWIR